MTAGARNLYEHIEETFEDYGPEAVLEAFKEWLDKHPADGEEGEPSA